MQVTSITIAPITASEMRVLAKAQQRCCFERLQFCYEERAVVIKTAFIGVGIDDIALILQQNRLRWYGHVLRKDDDDLVKKCMEYEVEGPRPRGRPTRTWREVVREDCQARKLNNEWVNVSSGTGLPG